MSKYWNNNKQQTNCKGKSIYFQMNFFRFLCRNQTLENSTVSFNRRATRTSGFESAPTESKDTMQAALMTNLVPQNLSWANVTDFVDQFDRTRQQKYDSMTM